MKLFCVLFKLTGLPEDKARFQVISILTSTGFTTRESELITQHPTRRRLAQNAMILGYVGLATIIPFLVTILKESLNFYNIIRFILVFAVILFVLRNRHVLEAFDAIVEKIVMKQRLKNKVRRNIYKLMHQSHGYGLYHVLIDRDSPYVGITLREAKLKQTQIQVLSIDKGNAQVPFPDANYVFEKGDNILVYGKTENIVDTFNLR